MSVVGETLTPALSRGERGKRHVHVVGAGLAGLAAALSLVEGGVGVTVHDSAPHAGGRCRSYFDPVLGCRIDNGNHLLLSGNRATFGFLDQVGARGTLTGPGAPVFPFIDLVDGARWVLRPNMGRVPWWLLVEGRRVPGMRLRDLWGVLRLGGVGAEATVAEVLPEGVLYRRLLEPLAVAALNTPPGEASARLLGAVMRESLGAGGRACVPWFPREGLSESFVDPAVAWLEARGARFRLGSRVGALEALTAEGAVVLAVPAGVAAGLVPGLVVPERFESILNVHYRYEAIAGEAGFVGVVGGLAEWVFVKPGVVSVTISAGSRAMDTPSEALAQQVWADVCRTLEVDAPLPVYRVVREKRATFAATPEQEGRRPPTRTARADVVLAGDWTATGLPATIEGAIRSGRAAAEALL